MRTFPNHTVLLENTRIIRERRLPDGLYGEHLVDQGMTVNATDVVLRGTRASEYLIIDVAGALRLDPDDDALIKRVIPLNSGDKVTQGQLLGKPGKRAPQRRIPRAPIDGVVSVVQGGRVILQTEPEEVEVLARMAGRVVSVNEGFSVTIEDFGTVIQCAWGNGRFDAAPYDFEPGFDNNQFTGLADLLGLDVSLSPYRGKTVILMRPLEAFDLTVIEQHELAGIVAPSAPPELRDLMLRQSFPVILTEGFGKLAPTSRLYDMLFERRNTPAAFDAVLPELRQNHRPEIIISGGRRDAALPQTGKPLVEGMRVRLRRAPYAGRIGKITELPEAPVTLESGLRVLAAQVRLQNGDHVLVPRANVESLGEA